jgi:hypothetical protein
MAGHLVCWRYGITNNTPFAWTNVSIFVALSTNTSGVVSGTTWNPSNEFSVAISVPNYVPAGGLAYSNWYPLDPTYGAAGNFVTTNMIGWANNALPTSWPYLTIPDTSFEYSRSSKGYLPYVNISRVSHPIAYHVQFTALTNYLDHAPAR